MPSVSHPMDKMSLLDMLTGEIPRELGSLSDLVLMYLHTNRLTGSIPPELGALSSTTVASAPRALARGTDRAASHTP